MTMYLEGEDWAKINGFRLSGDVSHLAALIALLIKIWKTKSCADVSGRSQILFAMMYTTRYLDLFSNHISIYNSVMKVIFLGMSYVTLYLIYVKFEATYGRKHDTFRINFLLIPAIVLAIVLNHNSSSLEVFWTFSIYLESVAILPQFFMLFKTGKAKTIMLFYLFCLGSYRVFYILNWVYRYYLEGYYDLIAITAGAVQIILYYVFFCVYFTKECVLQNDQSEPWLQSSESLNCKTPLNAESVNECSENSSSWSNFIFRHFFSPPDSPPAQSQISNPFPDLILPAASQPHGLCINCLQSSPVQHLQVQISENVQTPAGERQVFQILPVQILVFGLNDNASYAERAPFLPEVLQDLAERRCQIHITKM